MPTVDPITATTTIPANVFDPMLVVVRAILISDDRLPELNEDNVTIVKPKDTPEEIDAYIQVAMQNTTGLSVLIIPGGGKNTEKELESPRLNLAFEIQVFTHPQLRADATRSHMEIVMDIFRVLHATQVSAASIPWMERIVGESFDPLPDPDFVAHVIEFTRETQF